MPVLLDRVLELLGPALERPGAVLVDATLGLAGHSLALLAAHPGLRLVGLDRDPDARAEAARRIEAAVVADVEKRDGSARSTSAVGDAIAAGL